MLNVKTEQIDKWKTAGYTSVVFWTELIDGIGWVQKYFPTTEDAVEKHVAQLSNKMYNFNIGCVRI